MTTKDPGDERFRLAFESAPNAMIMVDEGGTIVLANAQTEKLFGYTRAELLEMSIDRLVPERFRGGHPGHRKAFFAEPQARSMGAGRDLFGLRKNGTEVPVEIGLNPIKTEKGSFVLAAVVDITERKRAEERFRLVVESAPNAMLMVDDRGKIVLVNTQAERLFGYPRQELLNQSIDVLVPHRFRHQHPKDRSEFQADPKSRPMGAGRELHAIRKDGIEIPVEIGLNPIRTNEGVFILAAVVDISERMRAQKALAEMQEELLRTQSLAAVGEMAATVAHEVKNPLAAISGPLQILSDDLKPGDPRKELMQEILGQVRRLDATVRGLLAFAKPYVPQKQRVVLRDIADRVARLMADHGSGKGIRITVDEGESLSLTADPVLIEQVFWNLFLNAAESMKGGGAIRVTVRTVPGALEAEISDSGTGISAEMLPRIFNPFVTTKSSGTGLGLPLCRKIIEAHGGTIEVSSQMGRGTTARIRLPRS